MQVPVTPKPTRALLDLVARAEAEPDSAEAYFLAQLRAAIAGIEGTGRPAWPLGHHCPSGGSRPQTEQP